jgi:isopentenyl phosphate kinase
MKTSETKVADENYNSHVRSMSNERLREQEHYALIMLAKHPEGSQRRKLDDLQSEIGRRLEQGVIPVMYGDLHLATKGKFDLSAYTKDDDDDTNWYGEDFQEASIY